MKAYDCIWGTTEISFKYFRKLEITMHFLTDLNANTFLIYREQFSFIFQKYFYILNIN